METKTVEENKKEYQKIIEKIIEALLNIKYGEIIITIHDSKVVQIEKRQKLRFK